MLEKLKTLITMQHIDDIIGEKETIRESLPKQLDSLKKAVVEAEAVEAEAKAKLEQNVTSQKTNELEVKANKDKIKKYSEQLNSIKTNKEYKALNSEIAVLNKKNEKIDKESEKLLEQETILKASLNEAKKDTKAAKDDLKSQEDVLKKDYDALEEVVKELRTFRNEYAVKLPKPLVRRYGQMIKFKERKAVVFNDAGACSGCGFNIRPQVQIEIQEANKMMTCESCGRILTARPEEDFYKEIDKKIKL